MQLRAEEEETEKNELPMSSGCLIGSFFNIRHPIMEGTTNTYHDEFTFYL